MLKVLYEDNHIIAAFKPARVLSQGDKTGDADMLSEVKKYLKEKYKKSGNVFVGLLHRLDRPVSGVMLFAKTSKGASRLSEQFRNREVQKMYHALVVGRPQNPSGTIVSQVEGQAAVLHYQLIKPGKQYSLLKISIEGGKYHQIRVQLSGAGWPIVGDGKYGGEKWAHKGSIALCATGLSFTAATVDKRVDLAIDIPPELLDN